MVRLDEIFEIWYGVNLEFINCDVVLNKDGIPFVSRTSNNNGIVGYVQELDEIEPNPPYSLSIAGSGSVLSTFFHPYPYYSGRDVYIAKPKSNLSEIEMIFYCSVIEKNKYRYNYGRQANKTLRNILVPSIDEIPELVKNYKTIDIFIEKPIIDKKFELNTESWKWFNYTELFDIKGSKTTPKELLEDFGTGKYPYVTTQAENNGIENYFDYYTEESAVFTIDSAVLGFCAYQELKFSASDHVEKLIPKFKCNIYISLFITTIINKEQYRFNYGRKCSQKKLKMSKIKLPVSPDGSPDWQFMEDYIKSLPYSRNL
jgi:hypothetical protein